MFITRYHPRLIEIIGTVNKSCLYDKVLKLAIDEIFCLNFSTGILDETN